MAVVEARYLTCERFNRADFLREARKAFREIGYTGPLFIKIKWVDSFEWYEFTAAPRHTIMQEVR